MYQLGATLDGPRSDLNTFQEAYRDGCASKHNLVAPGQLK
jgi:hypothetical protein